MNFVVICIQGNSIVCVEASRRRVATLRVKGSGAEICHSNHALCDQRLAGSGALTTGGTDVGSCSSISRLENVRMALRVARESTSGLNVEKAKSILLQCPAAHEEYAPTIATVVMDPEQFKFHVKFRQDSDWAVVSLR